MGSALANRSAAAARHLFDLALAPERVDVQSRLADIPVYTVANKNNEFILISGQADTDKRQLGLFFFCEEDAKALVEKLKQEDPQLAKQSQVIKVTMDRVYSFSSATTGDTNDAKGVVFRFMPDWRQVKQAMQLYEEAGLKVAGFTGVPVFQAEGLSLKAGDARFTPLFFSKDDLDAAVGNAFSQQAAQREAATRAKHSRAQQDLEEAKKQLEDAQSRDARKQAQAAVNKAADRLKKYDVRLGELAAAGPPKVEVGCLEEVLAKMESDTRNEWSDVMFVPPNSIQQK
jgi:uncharacterized protein YdcH (DUF465 family)